jgi:hypothetical protein
LILLGIILHYCGIRAFLDLICKKDGQDEHH